MLLLNYFEKSLKNFIFFVMIMSNIWDQLDTDFHVEQPKKSSKKWLISLFLLVLVVLIVWFVVKDPFSWGLVAWDQLKISYIARYDNGDLFQKKTKEDPLVFVLWEDTFPLFLQKHVAHMKKGETQTFDLQPAEEFKKYYDRRLQQKIPKFLFDQMDIKPQIGHYYDLWNITWIIISLEGTGTAQQVILDSNPLNTRKPVHYTITLLDVIHH